MPVPYSDNLYSALDDEDNGDYAQSSDAAAASVVELGSGSNSNEPNEADRNDEDEALSPSDGYFHASDAVASYEPAARRQSPNVPVVPNVLVEDPTLRDDDRDTKTREAEHERRLSNMAALQQQATSALPSQSPPASSSSRSRHAHRRSVEQEPEDLYGNSAANPRSSAGVVHPPPQQQQSGPLFQQQHFDAPPAYTPSPTAHSQPSVRDQTPSSPRSTSSSGAGYQTFGSPPTSAGASMGQPTEHQRLLPHPREPESMGGESGQAAPRNLWQRSKRAFTVTDGRRKLARVLKWLVIFVIVLAVFSGFTISGKHHAPEITNPDDPQSPPEDPRKPDPSRPDDPAKPSRPPVKDPGNGQDQLTWRPRKYCRTPERDFRLRAHYGAEFGSSQSLSVAQKMISVRGSSWTQPNIEGEVVLRRTADSQPRGSIQVEVMTNAVELETNIQFESDTQELLVTTPNHVDWKDTLRPCIQMRVTVSVPARSVLEDLIVNTTQLNIDIVKGLDLGVQHETLLHTIAGDVNAPAQKASLQSTPGQDDPYLISNRRIIIETISGNVKGWFPLNDLLKVTSAAGDLDLEIAPKDVDPENPSKAEMRLNTASGDITVTEPIDNVLAGNMGTLSREFPGRDYYVDIGSASGDVTANLAYSSYANIRSQSSDLKLTLLPVLDPSSQSQSSLSTHSQSGDTKLQVLEPLWIGIIKPKDQRLEGPPGGGNQGSEEPHDGGNPWVIIHPHDAINTETVDETTSDVQDKRPLGHLLSRHGTISGDIRLRYPASWEGSLTAETISGSQHIRGEGLSVYDVGTPLMKTFTGRKGNGDSDMKIVTVSGDEDVLIGKELA